MGVQQSVLLIDDDIDSGDFVRAVVEEIGWKCVATTSASVFFENLTAETTLIFLDLMMPDVDGIELLRALGEMRCEAGIVLMSGVGRRVMDTADEMAKVLNLFVVGHLDKPFQAEDIEAILIRDSRPAKGPAVPTVGRKMITDLELSKAIAHEQFVAYYQPQINIITGEVAGVEALVRWLHPTRGMIFPDSFIARLEVLNLIDELGLIVARRALNDIGRLTDENGAMPTISINVSVRSLHDLKFPDTLETLANKSGVPAGKVMIEITESGLINELARTLDVLTRLRMKAFKLSIDDFGTGYSMMKQLRHIPATELKIDKSFVGKMTTSPEDRVLVQKTIEIGHELGMKVVAEGVETVEQLEFLRLSNCDLAQGYLFSRPQPIETLLLWLKEYRATLVKAEPKTA